MASASTSAISMYSPDSRATLNVTISAMHKFTDHCAMLMAAGYSGVRLRRNERNTRTCRRRARRCAFSSFQGVATRGKAKSSALLLLHRGTRNMERRIYVGIHDQVEPRVSCNRGEANEHSPGSPSSGLSSFVANRRSLRPIPRSHFREIRTG